MDSEQEVLEPHRRAELIRQAEVQFYRRAVAYCTEATATSSRWLPITHKKIAMLAAFRVLANLGAA